MDDRRKAIADAEYEAWRAGFNPDCVDGDLVADDLYLGYSPWESAEREVDRMYRDRLARHDGEKS